MHIKYQLLIIVIGEDDIANKCQKGSGQRTVNFLKLFQKCQIYTFICYPSRS
jgi:hypothetical protein